MMTDNVIVHTLLERSENLWQNFETPRNQKPRGKYSILSHVTHALERNSVSQRTIVPADEIAARVAAGATVEPTFPRKIYNLVTGQKPPQT